jgi:hypothetical protein
MDKRAHGLAWSSLLFLLVASPNAFAARESGERAGTEDINIGVGKLQSTESGNESGTVTFGDGVRGRRPAASQGAPGATETDSVVDELGGIVVLCADGGSDQNACVPRENGAAGGEGGAEARIPETLRHRDR